MSYKTEIADMKQELRNLYKSAPATTAAFSELTKAAESEGDIGAKEKEFVALGIAISQRCMPCINFHTSALIKLGATRGEFVGVLNISIQMSGGPGLMYAAHALACWDELTS